MTVGFHTRSDLKKASRRGSSRQAMPLETIERMGSRAVADMNPNARSPNLQPHGPDDADLYVLGNWPASDEDKMGKAWGHSYARPVRKFAGRVGARYSHAVRTRPAADKPKDHEVLAFRREVLEDIEATRPKVVLACGNLAFLTLQPGLASHLKSQMHIHRGRKFPLRVGTHTCWLVPTFSMEEYHVLIDKGDKTCRDGKQWQRFLDEDIQLAVSLAKCSKKPFVEVHDAGRIVEQAGTKFLYSVTEILDALREFKRLHDPGALLSYDYETQKLRPYMRGARVDTLALHTSSLSVAFPVQHPRIKWTKVRWEEFLDLLWDVYQLYECVAHSQEFETEWDMHLLGRDAARAPKRRHCTIVQAYVLLGRVGRDHGSDDDTREASVSGLSLDYLCRLHRGLPLKSLSDAKLWEERDALPDLLKYNALDAILTMDVFLDQEAEIEAEKLEDIYAIHMRRIPTAVLSQWDGVPVSQDAVDILREQYQSRLDEAESTLRSLDEIKEFDRRFGRRFNPMAPEDVKKLFTVILKQDLKSGTEGALLKFIDAEFSAKYILAYKKAHKSLSTYVSPFDTTSESHHIMPDGNIHCKYFTCRVQTGRVSSGEPNMTNLPERGEGKDCKRPMAAPKGWEWTAFDYRQLEACGFAMASKDKVFVKALWDKYDVHLDWAKRLSEAFPELLRRFDGDIDKCRGFVKNKAVFPWFFGAGVKSVATSLGADDELIKPVHAEFKRTFSGCFAWHKTISKFFDRNGYVETLTGRRRYGPMSFNAQVNMPIQALGADICFNAWDRISERGMKENMPFLQPRMMVHDDLKFLHPISERDTIMEIVPKMMCDVPYSFVNVPMVVEATRGPNLCDMDVCGEFSSEDYR